MSGRGSGPGAAVETAIDEFVAAWTAGERPDVDAFCRAHGESGPELKPYLEEFVSVRESLAGDDEPLLEGSAPRTLGDFRLLREIGRGGMGVVYEAEQISLRRPVAVKVLSGHRTLRPESIERFRREASTAARLEHPSIVRVFAVGEENGIHFFAMERVEGISLGDLLERRRQRGEPPENVGAVCRRVARIADALEFARRAGVVHRDVKPSNVLIRGDGTPVLTDFGLAREQGLPSVTRTGEFAGTPSYLSPEQAKGAAV
ncbi:MAG TPA: serine/threonine-protein kinase, partial [Planctomycetota bacterium]|nr:serine/threonine-protein kinase [Planctomycetota bacterium]